jgi:hypothetical protein
LDIDTERGAAELAARALELGRQGCGRAEIAATLGLEMAELAALEAADADFARAMRRAGEAERAWWEAQPREALAAGARINFGAWREAMRWRWGAAEAGADEAAEPAAPARQEARFYLPYNGRLRRLPDGTPMTPALHRAHAMAQVQAEIDRVEQKLAHWQAEMTHWQEEMREVEARDWGEGDDEAGDDEDWDDDCDEEDLIDDDDAEDDRSGDDDADDAGSGDEWDGRDGRDGRGADGGAGADGRVSAGAAGCERAVPAGLAGPPAWAAQPDFGAGGAGPVAGLRDRSR